MPLAACPSLVGQSIPLVCGSPSFLVTWSLGHWSLGHFRFVTRRPGTPPRHPMSHPAIGIGHPVSAPPVARARGHRSRPPMCAPRPPNLMVRYSRIPIRHTNFGIRKSESQNRESGNAESWCGRVGQTKRSCFKRSIPPFRIQGHFHHQTRS